MKYVYVESSGKVDVVGGMTVLRGADVYDVATTQRQTTYTQKTSGQPTRNISL